MNQADLRRLFAACDGNKSGRVEYEDFTSVCRELNVPADEIRTLFNKFDLDGDGYINFNDFSSSFQEVSEALNLALLGNRLQSQRSAWDGFENTFDGDVAFYLGRQWDELRELYEQIHSTSDELLLQQYEDLIKALVAESKEHRMESEQLETSLRRTEELTSSHLAEMEEDLQLQLARTEERVREEDRGTDQQSFSRDGGGLAAATGPHGRKGEGRGSNGKQYIFSWNGTEKSILWRPLIGTLAMQIGTFVILSAFICVPLQENEELRSSLMKAQINVSILQVELDRLKNAFTDQKLQHERESDDLKKMVMEYQSYSNQIEFLQLRTTQIEDLHDTEDLAPVYRLVLAGDAGSGKSSFLLRLSLNEFRGDIQTTLGVDFQIKKMLVDGEKTNLQIWDTAGQERFRSIARSYFRKAHGVLLLYDVTSESSFLNVREWVQQIRESTDEDIPMCIIGNKVDLRAERPEGSCVSAFHGEKLAMAYNALFCEASAKEGTNVIEAVLHLAREVKKHAKLGRRSESQVKLSCPKRKKTLSNCCGV
ncbi:ras and EF-hand domain-containing protein-like [Sinocyclocheilus grahami]|uniref:ras and EF-hand domain-containing protein-like n=1 Tax=Sinocyclocheilus grahami TaxID=75366 RepID=UPI0007ACB56E|nr:PREDICTED: ras and EF-hand domain-containing protein-like [Sinocyclocheilus grahami]